LEEGTTDNDSKELIMKEQYTVFYQLMNSIEFLKDLASINALRAGRAYKLATLCLCTVWCAEKLIKGEFEIQEH
jgi:hypothetical protein